MLDLFSQWRSTCSRRRRETAAILVAVLLAPAFARPAHAQPDAPARADAAAADADAKERFAGAVQRFRDGRAADALPLFRQIAADTGSPNAHLYVGHCLLSLGDYVEAHAAFARTLELIGENRDEKYEATRDAAVLQLAELEPRVAKLVVSVADAPRGLTVELNGQLVDPTMLGSAVILAPGAHRIDARAAGMIPLQREVRIEGGEMKTLALALRPLEQRAALPSPPQAPRSAGAQRGSAGGTYRTLGIVSGGVALAGLSTFAIAGLSAKSTRDELAADCPRGCADAAHREDIDRGKRLQTIANVGLAVGLAGAAASGALLFFGFSASEETGGTPQRGAGLALGGDRAVVTYGGRF